MNPVRDPSVMFYTYILQSKNTGRFYTGCTKDLRKRFNLHNQGRSSHTRKDGLWELIYYEACLSQVDAYAREKYLKTAMGKRYIKNRLKRFLSLMG
jgi:putative endonuclease